MIVSVACGRVIVEAGKTVVLVSLSVKVDASMENSVTVEKLISV